MSISSQMAWPLGVLSCSMAQWVAAHELFFFLRMNFPRRWNQQRNSGCAMWQLLWVYMAALGDVVMWVSRATICEEMMPTRVSAVADTCRRRGSPVTAWMLLAFILFHGACADSPDEANLLRFLETAQPNFRSVYNTSAPACDWVGIVSCIGLGAGQQIWTVNFNGRGLTGTILPGTLGLLRSLQSLDLSNNLLVGDIPLDIFDLQSLTSLGLDQNSLTGSIPVTVGNLAQLAVLNLSQNMLSGPVPETLGDLEFLKVLDLHSNNFNGTIPVFSKPTQLQHLDLSSNQFSGEVPWAFDELAVLTYLNLSSNLMTGPISWQFQKLEALQVLDVSGNSFEGPIPSFGNLHQLKAVSLSSNRFNGTIPASLTELPLLQDLILSNNRLQGSLPQLSLSIIVLDCSDNSLNGSVPAGVLASQNLTVVRLASNNFTGPLPTNVSSAMRELNFRSNSFSGSIPQNITTLSSLEVLELSSNQLNGSVPWDFAMLSSIRHVGLARNSFREGRLPDVSRMVSISHLNLSFCNLGGPIPNSFAALANLVLLDLSHNHLNGSIPGGLARATHLELLDVSFNNLSGAIPTELTSLVSLNDVNFSYNRLSGEVPRSRVWDTFNVSAFEGNPDLCGYVLNRICSSSTPFRHHRLRMGAILGILIGSIISCCGFFTILLLLLKSKPKKLGAKEVSKYLSSKLPVTFEADPSTWAVQVPHSGSIPVIMFEKPLLNLSFADLLQATSNFHKDNQISDGGYGPSYKGSLPGGFQIVVKALFEGGPANEFEKAAQLEALGKIRHPNLVSLVGYCLVGEERLLVYEFMENGDLQRRLHELPEGNHNPDDWTKDTWENPDNEARGTDELSWPIRHRIALGVARALAFLHHGCSPHLVHRDVTSSNILLDSSYEPHLADCGLAALIASETPAIGGALGYVPPEYGHMWKASTRGDVYSFGVVLLELVTGKRPTGHYFHDSYGGNLVGWVRALIREKRGYKCLDPKLASTGVESEMLETLRIGYLCTAELPSKRPTMQQIVGLLKDIQPEFSA